jgi:hypothetical protein
VLPFQNAAVRELQSLTLVGKVFPRKGNENQFIGARKKMMDVAQAILRTEWNRVKEAL